MKEKKGFKVTIGLKIISMFVGLLILMVFSVLSFKGLLEERSRWIRC